MTENKQQALEVLDVLFTESDIDADTHELLRSAILEGPPVGAEDMLYTVFMIDGAFVDEDAVVLRFNGVDRTELGTLLQIAMRQDYDIVIRTDEQE